MVLVLNWMSALASRWDAIPVAINALRGRAPVEANGFPVHLSLVFVALPARNFVVCAVQREIGLAVIECPRFPMHHVVARRAVLFLARAHELAGMHILVALETLLRRF